ncbi:hypothetical protein IG631_22417 [Alternaria alternata]|jgi:hypothetical protein|nr:hypothetical protein IG631_22417 [Alternaria alternata]
MLDRLPLELCLTIAVALGADATLRDWVSISATCRAWRHGTRIWLHEWLSTQKLGSTFSRGTWSVAELSFASRHVDSEYTRQTAFAAWLT